MKLGLDDDELSSCVACGLCLPHCPTFRVTGDETRSPRGRIAAMRAVERDGAPIDDAFRRVIDECVQCRGCEPACPSGVPFGHLMESTRAALAESTAYVPTWKRASYRLLGRQRLLLVLSTLLAVAQRLGLVPGRLGVPRLPLRRPRLTPTGDDVWLFTGCVMDAWLRRIHVATVAVLGAAGVGVRLPSQGGCCGALHVHAGLAGDARSLAARVMASMPGDAPIVVNSAGCGAALKDYRRLLGTQEAAAFSARVHDVHEWLAPKLAVAASHRLPYIVAVQDPCHLRHVQKAHAAVRMVLAPFVDVVELDDEGLCCGAGGAYAVEEPELAGAIRDRKVEAIARSGARVVASANPGCALHLSAAGVDVRHPLEIVAEALQETGPEVASGR